MIETINSKDKELTVRISGTFVFDIYKEFTRVYKDNKGKYDKFILDMRETKYMDTSALAMLLQMREYLEADKKDIHIINCNNNVGNLFKISNFDELFTLVSSS